MSILTHEMIHVDGGPLVDMFAHADGTVVFDTSISLGKTYSATSLQMPAADALRIATALTKAALAALAHQNAQADAQIEGIAA